MKKILIAFLSVVALLLTFTACGGGGGGGSDPASPDTGNPSPVTPDNNEDEELETVPSTPFNLSSNLGTPPGVPN